MPKPQLLVIVKPRFTGLLKTRCEPDLEQTYKFVAAVRKVDTADLVRDALREYAKTLTSARKHDAETAAL